MATNIQGFPLEVAYFTTDKDGFMQREDFNVTAAYDVPLKQTIAQIPLLMAGGDNLGIVCKGDNFKGKEIDLDKKPVNIEYFFQTFYNKKTPVLFITRASNRPDSGIFMERETMSVPRRPTVSADMLKNVLQRKASSSSSNLDSGETRKISVTQRRTSDGPERISDALQHHDSDDDIFAELQMNPSQRPLRGAATLRPSRDVPRAPLVSVGGMETHNEHQTLIMSNSALTLSRAQMQSSTLSPGQMHTSTRTITSPQLQTVVFRNREGGFTRSKREAFRRKRTSTVDLNVQQITLQVAVDNGHTAEIHCHSHITVREVKHFIGHELSSAGKLPGKGGLSLTYEFEGKTHELFNDSQMLINTVFLRNSEIGQPEEAIPGLKCGCVPVPEHRDLVIIYRITQLTRVILDDRVTELGGDDLQDYTVIAAPDKTEMEAARRMLHDFVIKVTGERPTEDYVLSVDIAVDTAPTTLILKVPFNNLIPVTFHYTTVFSLTKQISIHQTAEAILKVIHHCLLECDLIKNGVEGYTMQVSGVNTFIHGNHELIAFTDIRRCITKKEPIHLSVLEKPSCLLYQPFDISWLPLDPHSYTPPCQMDVSEAYRRDTRSLWECPESECFRLRLVRAENLPFESSNMISVEFSLHLGSHMLHGVRATEEKGQDSFTMTWNEDIDFITPLRDVPKAAKVLVVVRKSNSNSYYWGMINIFDHQSRLRSGDHVINLWEVKTETTKKTNKRQSVIFVPLVEKEEEAFSSILPGPAADNPSPNAVRVVINFGAQELPIFYPSLTKKSWKKLFEQHPAFPNFNLRRHFNEYLRLRFNMRSNKKPYHSLPLHIESINWNSLKDRLEVYIILEKIGSMEEVDEEGKVVKELDGIPLYVAFRLLDKDFPDEEVRAFAVKIIEHQVRSDTLEDYLLQLIQALKFEHNHDSALARYLLKQAVTNRHIGNLLFWYLRGEMQNPQYMLRYAVILEAYLKGCGEALVTKYMNHVIMQDSLESIGQKLKDTYGKDSAKMQQALPNELERAELQKMIIVPAFNPRFQLGGLRSNHCKVMSSAKKPLFLEMLNVNPTALRTDPIRLIMKMGDDLRQDMITLRMLSLFEKLWENEGLDLKLIPYGCMATGPRTGFIEVVRNSKTIAEVSGVRENKKLYEWIKNHQKDEFGEVDPEKLKAAIDTFVHSCAGYSVATYILGIGDRHNDNIMITTSGNLFHIDFGHFLGNIKHFMTFKREWSPFVLTPDFTYVMGGEESETFQFYKHLCIRAFLILRRHADLIINLFSMMRSTGIPELTCVEDTDYIKTALAIEKTDAEAEKEFQTIIKKCLDLRWTVQVMWGIHKLRNQSK